MQPNTLSLFLALGYTFLVRSSATRDIMMSIRKVDPAAFAIEETVENVGYAKSKLNSKLSPTLVRKSFRQFQLDVPDELQQEARDGRVPVP